MIFFRVNDQTRQGHFLIYWGSGKANKSDYFTKYHPPIHHRVTRNEYIHKTNHSFIFVPPRGCINHGIGLTSPSISHETGVPKYEHQEPGGSTDDCLTVLQKEIRPKYNCQ